MKRRRKKKRNNNNNRKSFILLWGGRRRRRLWHFDSPSTYRNNLSIGIKHLESQNYKLWYKSQTEAIRTIESTHCEWENQKIEIERKLKDGIGMAEKIFFLCVLLFAVLSRMILFFYYTERKAGLVDRIKPV